MTMEHPMDWAAARSEKWRRHLAGLEAMLAPVDEPLLETLALNAPLRVADIGCGGGATSLAVLRRSPPGSVVHGLDLSSVLIDVARRRCVGEYPSARFDIADMATAVNPAQPYDRLVSRCGVMFFNDAPAAFANLRRWIAADGRFAFAVWGPVEDNAWMSHTRDAVAEVAELEEAQPGAPGPFRYGDVAPLVALLTGVGFADVAVTDWRGDVPMGHGLNAGAAAEFALASFSSFAELLSRVGDDAPARARRALAARFAEHERDGGVVVPARVHIVSGRAGGLGKGGIA